MSVQHHPPNDHSPKDHPLNDHSSTDHSLNDHLPNDHLLMQEYRQPTSYSNHSLPPSTRRSINRSITRSIPQTSPPNQQMTQRPNQSIIQSIISIIPQPTNNLTTKPIDHPKTSSPKPLQSILCDSLLSGVLYMTCLSKP